MAKPPKWSPSLKLQVALEALNDKKTIIQIASDHQIHPKQVQRWRDQLMEEGEGIFLDKRIQAPKDPDKEDLVHIIDNLREELEFLKKKLKKRP